MHFRRILIPFLFLLGVLLPATSLWSQTDSPRIEEGEVYAEQDNIDTITAEAPPEAETYTEEDYADKYSENQRAANVVFSKLAPPLPQKDRDISAGRWQQLINDAAFQYEDPKPKVKPKKENSGPSAWFRFIEAIANFFSSVGGKILLLVLVSLLILLIVFRIYKLRGNIFFARKDKKIGPSHEDELSDDFVPDSWDKVIQDAAKAGNYRLAVRHSYRYLLSLLQEREIIKFQVAKTNYQYAYELSGSKLHQPFLQLTRGYEYVWYGGFPIAKENFEAYYEQINGIKKGLS